MAQRLKSLNNAQAYKVLDWCIKHMGLSHWSIQLWFQDDPPDWFGEIDGDILGRTSWDHTQRRAKIWVSPARNKHTIDCVETIVHECIHLFAEDNGVVALDDRQHHFVYQLETILAKAYLKGVK
jgi:hypothetical protein